MKSQYDTLKNGLKIHSLTAGDPALPPLVLLHGYPTNAYLWRNCIPRLAEHFRVYAPDLPGYGKSDKPLDASYDLDFFTAFLLEYYSALGLERAHLAVHDVGAQAGLGFVSRFPEKTDRFIVMNTAPYKEVSRKLEKGTALCSSPFWSRLLLLKSVFYYTTFRDRDMVYAPGTISAETSGLFHASWVENKTSRKAFSQVLCAPPEAITVQPRSKLSNISAPTLILWAENDGMMGTEPAKKLASDLPNSTLEFVPECGHFLPEENPETVTDRMLGFLLR
ncbi:MAG: alpha/beta hydrolase [bacterium]|nr:alpha/beta hydrolase [bacterium]